MEQPSDYLWAHRRLMEKTLRCLVENALAFQESEEGKSMKKLYSSRGFIDEYATIRLGAGRRSGHTTSILKAMDIWPESILVVPMMSSRGLILDTNPRLKDRVFHKDDVMAGALRGREFRIIFVDNAFYFGRKSLRAIREELTAHYACGPVLLVLVQ